MKKAIWLCIGLLFFFFPQFAFAVTLSLDEVPDAITDQPFYVTVTVAGASAGTNYLRIDLYKDGSTDYFGETFSGTEWYGGGEGKQYFPVTIVANSSTTTTLQGKLGTPSLSAFLGEGEYKVRIRRYTESGNTASTDQVPKTLIISYSFPTATPTLTLTPTQNPTSTPTRIPTPTRSPTPTMTLTPVPTKTVERQSVTKTQREYPEIQVLPRFSPTPRTEVKGVATKAPFFDPISLIFIVSGVFIVSSCGILIFLKKRRI